MRRRSRGSRFREIVTGQNKQHSHQIVTRLFARDLFQPDAKPSTEGHRGTMKRLVDDRYIISRCRQRRFAQSQRKQDAVSQLRRRGNNLLSSRDLRLCRTDEATARRVRLVRLGNCRRFVRTRFQFTAGMNGFRLGRQTAAAFRPYKVCSQETARCGRNSGLHSDHRDHSKHAHQVLRR